MKFLQQKRFFHDYDDFECPSQQRKSENLSRTQDCCRWWIFQIVRRTNKRKNWKRREKLIQFSKTTSQEISFNQNKNVHVSFETSSRVFEILIREMIMKLKQHNLY